MSSLSVSRELPVRRRTELETGPNGRTGFYERRSCGLLVSMPGDGTDPVDGFRSQLQQLFVRVHRPTYRSLVLHADQHGRTLRTSTIGNLLNGPPIPRWDTVETFVRACASYAQAHKMDLPPRVVDLDRWQAGYRAMENALADQAARREQIAGRAVPTRRRRVALPAQLPPDVPGFTGRAEHLAEPDELLPEHQQPG